VVVTLRSDKAMNQQKRKTFLVLGEKYKKYKHDLEVSITWIKIKKCNYFYKLWDKTVNYNRDGGC